MIHNEYIPVPAVIEEIRIETPDTKTFRVRFLKQDKADAFSYEQGQFMEVSIFGAGEAPISIASSPSRRGFLEFTIRAAGKVTKAIHGLKTGDTLFIRGPYGKPFPFIELKDKNLYFIAGGIGLAPLRSLINRAFDNRQYFKQIKIFYGAKTPEELCFKDELTLWAQMPDTEVLITVDKSSDGWKGRTGVATALLKQASMDPGTGIAIVCGPPVMIRYAIIELIDSGFKPHDIIMTLERYMKCGIGKCGHCNIAGEFVCTDGPVFTYEQVTSFPSREGVF
jgi:sulfhydrogenase subunit gamma (sulfur reductase)